MPNQKTKWFPKVGEIVYFIIIIENKGEQQLDISNYKYNESYYKFLPLYFGNGFKTYEEAQIKLNKIKKLFKS